MKLLTLMLKELIEMIEILQFRCYFKLGMSLHKLMCPVQQFLILLLFAQGKRGRWHYINATVKSLQKVPIVRSNTYAFFH